MTRNDSPNKDHQGRRKERPKIVYGGAVEYIWAMKRKPGETYLRHYD